MTRSPWEPLPQPGAITTGQRSSKKRVRVAEEREKKIHGRVNNTPRGVTIKIKKKQNMFVHFSRLIV